MLTRDELVKPRTKTISIDGGDVIIRAMSAFEALELRGKDMHSEEIFAVIAQCIQDPKLTGSDIGLMPTSIVTQLTTEIFAFNALGTKAIEDAADELKKSHISGETSK